MKESELMKTIEIEISKQTNGSVPVFRVNVGNGYTGNEIIRSAGGGVYIPDARPFSAGVPKGFSDLFCVIPTFITPEMVGQTVGVAAFIEVKTPTGVIRREQDQFLAIMRARGAKAGIARSPEDAIRILGVRS